MKGQNLLRLILRRGLASPMRILDDWMLKFNYVGTIDGIKVCDSDPSIKRSESLFLGRTQDVLDLIREIDPRRFQRICRQFRYIVNRPMVSMGSYNRAMKICDVDYTKCFKSPDAEWNRRMYACVLIHEATHGELMERGVPYTRKNWRRTEKICRDEEMRFARRIDPEWVAREVRLFNPKDWKVFMGSRRAQWAAARSRIKEIFKSVK